jgi:dimethylaniline monooxygenase (N-oxide forming)
MSSNTVPDATCVIGAGCAGLAVIKQLNDRGIAVEAFEQGSDLGGNWRYGNEAGSGAYASLRTNVSRRRMQYPSMHMPKSYGDFVHHSDMASYFDAYADENGLRRHIRFSSRVEQIEPDAGGGWTVRLSDGSARRYRAVVVANGHDWDPHFPEFRGHSSAETSHARDYRTPDSFAGKRALVVGSGQSAIEIATEISSVCERTYIAVRGGTHVIPRYVLGETYDRADFGINTRLPFGLVEAAFGAMLSLTRQPQPSQLGFPVPDHSLLEELPALSSDLGAALRDGAITVKPNIAELAGAEVVFEDGSRAEVDAIVYATGYRISFPFLSRQLIAARGKELPLYRRIAAPGLPGLYFAGLVDAPSGMLPIVEAQGAWIADVLAGRLALPPQEAMWRAIDRAERRTRRRFPKQGPHSIRTDPHAYKRALSRDRNPLLRVPAS